MSSVIVAEASMAKLQAPQLRLAFLPNEQKGGLDLDLHDQLIGRLRGAATRIAARFRLPRYVLEADRAEARDRYGLCYSDGRIYVRLVHARAGRILKFSALIDTVVHELAHLRHMNHGPRWEALRRSMLAWARKEGIYEPSLRASEPGDELDPSPEPEQLPLFRRGRTSRCRKART